MASDSSRTSEAPQIVHEVLRSPGQPLDASTRAFMEPRFGHDFSGVRVHADDKAADSARAVDALAYTVGRDIVFGAGQFAPGTGAGRQIIAHELTHVAQQRHNQQASASLRVGAADDSFEAEAERNAASQSTDYAGAPLNNQSPQAGTIQRLHPAAAVGLGAAAFAAGFGIAFGIDYLSMTRERAERFAQELDTTYAGWLEGLPSCPCELPDSDPANWVRDSNPNLGEHHPGATYSYRSTAEATAGSRHGQQCTYDASRRLITSGAGAGTPDFYSPSSILNIPYHAVYDFKTFKELGWARYTQTWRPNNARGCNANSGAG